MVCFSFYRFSFLLRSFHLWYIVLGKNISRRSFLCFATVKLLQFLGWFQFFPLNYETLFKYIADLYQILSHYRAIPYGNTLPNYALPQYITELTFQIASSQSSNRRRHKLSGGVITSPRCRTYLRGRACKKKSVQFLELVPQCGKWVNRPDSLSF